MLLQPLFSTINDAWHWPGLEVRPSSIGNGLGVFATKDLAIGLVVPILGVPVNEHEYDEMLLGLRSMSHFWKATRADFIGFDGNPDLNTSGLNIAMMVNEDCHRKPNCIFSCDHLVTMLKIKQGDELSVYYGSDYVRNGYKLNGNINKCLNYSSKLKLPSAKIRRENARYWIQTLWQFETR